MDRVLHLATHDISSSLRGQNQESGARPAASAPPPPARLMLSLCLPARKRPVRFAVYGNSTVSRLAQDIGILLNLPPETLYIGTRNEWVWELGRVKGWDYWGEEDQLLADVGIDERGMEVVVLKDVWRNVLALPEKKDEKKKRDVEVFRDWLDVCAFECGAV